MKMSDQFLAYLLLRLTIGINFSFHAISRFAKGVGAFRDKMVADFSQTPLPGFAVYVFGTALSYIELILGLLLTIGLFTRVSAFAAGVLMMALTVGTSFQQKWDVVASQLIYSIIFFILIWAHQSNYYSVDRMMLGRD
ncbi:DoxX family membrane protein [Fibrella sp. WM1]|uniref:DoxX family membrane protein n=1 Tax=Fibrella musci TaxID=3242485 RepID=UPI00352161DA